MKILVQSSKRSAPRWYSGAEIRDKGLIIIFDIAFDCAGGRVFTTNQPGGPDGRRRAHRWWRRAARTRQRRVAHGDGGNGLADVPIHTDEHECGRACQSTAIAQAQTADARRRRLPLGGVCVCLGCRYLPACFALYHSHWGSLAGPGALCQLQHIAERLQVSRPSPCPTADHGFQRRCTDAVG